LRERAALACNGVGVSRWCVLCGAEYVEGVLECADCMVPLSDRRPLTLAELGSEDEQQVAYEFDELEPMQRLAIDELFAGNGIPHAWDGTSLVVREEDETEADRLIDEADRDAFLDSGAEQVAYDLGDWDDDRRAEIAQALDTAGIEHAWDQHGELIVLDADEERVDAMIDAIESPESPEEIAADEEEEVEAEEALEASEGLDPQDVLSELFVASDRLMHDPLDHEGVLSLVDAARLAETLPLPYGFAPAVWNDLIIQVKQLQSSLEGDVDDDLVIEQATTLRSTLRNFV
jgi:hypothetical protein